MSDKLENVCCYQTTVLPRLICACLSSVHIIRRQSRTALFELFEVISVTPENALRRVSDFALIGDTIQFFSWNFEGRLHVV